MTGVAALVLAAGEGTKFGGPKQYREVAPGIRLVDAAVAAVTGVCDFVVVVLPEGSTWDGAPVSGAAVGGATRFDSVAAGLAQIPGEADVVVIHDAAHPIAPQSMCARVIDAVRDGADAAVPFLPVVEVVKRLDEDGALATVGRDSLGLAQVPMAFERSILETAHQRATSFDDLIWEDSMLVERVGGVVEAVPGSHRNIHVVTEGDLEVARRLWVGDPAAL